MERRKGELNKKRTDAINHFYYLDASIGSNKVVIVLAMYGRQNKKYNYAKQKVHWTEVLKSVLRKCSTEIIGANHGD